MTEYWNLEPGYLAAYTEDKALIRRVNRYYAGKFVLMAEYYKGGRLIAVQWRVPSKYTKTVKRLFKASEMTA